MIKILAYSVARSDLDRFYPLLNSLNYQKKVNLRIVASYIHYMDLFGETVKDFKKNFKIEKRNFKKRKIKDNPNTLGKNLAEEIKFFSDIISKRKPDIILVMGDRYEMLSAAIAAIPYNIPIVHIYGGAVTEGAIDELVRHSITKMSHLHLTAHRQYSKRIIQMGEEKWRVKTIGVPEIKNLKKERVMSSYQLKKIINLNLNLKTLLITLHPTTLNIKNLKKQINNLLLAVKKSGYQAIFTYPNSDLGYTLIVKKIKSFCKNNSNYALIKNASLSLYSNLLKKCSVMVGNSSSGIVEATSFNLPVVNIGSRQDGKIKPKNVINTDFSSKKVLKSIRHATSKKFVKSIGGLKNPYEKEVNLDKISKMIVKIKDNPDILLKKFKDY